MSKDSRMHAARTAVRPSLGRRVALVVLTVAALALGLAAENVALPLGVILSGSALVVGLVGLAVGFGITAAVARLAARVGRVRAPGRFALAVGAVLALALLATTLGLNVAQPLLLPTAATTNDTAVVDALRQYAVPLTSTDVGATVDDLSTFGLAVAGKRVVALGEATHGTHEFFTVKERLIAYLVTTRGLRQIAVEVSAPTGVAANTYVHGGTIDIGSYLAFPFATTEFLGLLTWLRTYNAAAAPSDQVTITGIDPVDGDRDAGMAANVFRVLAATGPLGRVIVWAHNAHIANLPGTLGNRLVARLGASQVYLLGTEFDQGSFTSDAGVFGIVRSYAIGPASRAYYAWALARAGAPNLYLDFATAAQDPAIRQWLGRRLYTHDIGSQYGIGELTPFGRLDNDVWLSTYNGIIFVTLSTVSHALGQ